MFLIKKKRKTIHSSVLCLSILYVLPAFLLYSIFMIYPIVSSLFISMTHWNGIGSMNFVGFDNFINLLQSRDLWISLKNSFFLLVMSIIIQVPIAHILAYLLYRTPVLLKTYRAIFFMPAAISTAVIGIMFSLILNSDLGPFNLILNQIGLGFYARNWLSDKQTVLMVVSLCMIWQFIGYHMVIILSRMTTIPNEIIESVKLDGANTFQLFFYIITPLCKSMLHVCMMLAIVGSFKAFDIPYMMTWGGPGTSSTFLAIFMFKTAFLKAELGKGTAIGILILIFALLSTIINNHIFKKDVEE